ncbi:hypothetical protein [Oleidesulfovibrio sp.]|uniref:hypothetical protein n=1 Tax=Oleidesulfovibrio sp. TaxID=2909707 RepID=UPI003A8B3B99
MQPSAVSGFIKKVGADAVRVTLDLYKVMIPIIIAVKILSELDLIGYLALPLEPFMHFTGLPAELGLVWATSIVVNIYSGIIVFAAIFPALEPLTVAQVSVLSTMILVAHNLLVECKIAQRCGLSFMGQFALRMVAALIFGWILYVTFELTGTLQQPAQLMWQPDQAPADLTAWALGQARNLFYLFWVVLGLMTFMRLLDILGISRRLNSLLKPVLRMVGIGESAATITVIGLSMGIAYGGGLIIHEARSGKVPQKDVFSSVTLMGFSHALIEDTLLMMLIGAHMSATLWGRLLLSLLTVALLMRIYPRFAPEKGAAIPQPRKAQ